MLWPQAVTDRIKTGADREIIRTYPYRSAAPSTLWGELVAGAKSDTFLAGYTNYFFWTQQPHFNDTLREKAAGGCRIRVLLGDPESQTTRDREAIEAVALTVSTRIRMTLDELARLGPLDNVEVRFSAPEDAVNHVSLSTFRFDNDALVTPHLARLVGHDSPLLHLRRAEAGGMFDRFAESSEELWSRGRPV
ncbi:XRE family transcriptional regulator [Streptomyces luteolus]|uniref:XRE family transcriptional regulator n=1 Tax=Streptomyces luteolus TaxID=3043615 RepID=A0ABT6SY92_9ACTN|nr:XRE family transcriptional regulator [Streptomyces sp. B-S-A12]MDI3419814.1 XRE family transcriptional regulator [Streptomyces sp. B-S-A12]